MKSRLMKFAGAICLMGAICGPALAQSQPAMPNVAKLEASTEKLAIVSAGAGAVVGVIGFVVHHRHKSDAKKQQKQEANKAVPLAPSTEGASVVSAKLADAPTTGRN